MMQSAEEVQICTDITLSLLDTIVLLFSVQRSAHDRERRDRQRRKRFRGSLRTACCHGWVPTP